MGVQAQRWACAKYRHPAQVLFCGRDMVSGYRLTARAITEEDPSVQVGRRGLEGTRLLPA